MANLSEGCSDDYPRHHRAGRRPQGAPEITRLAEEAGFDAAWPGEFLHRSGIVSAAAMAAVTSRIGVGTSIAYAVGRSPLVLANDARFLDEMSDGRFTLGLGTGTRRMMTDWHGVPDPDGPASRIEELVPLLRRLWRLHEGPVRHQGRFFSVDMTPTAEIEPPLRADIPVWTAGVNPRMTEAAAQIAFYAAPKAYGPVMEAAGFGREAAAVRDAFRAGDHRAMVEAVSDAMLAEMAVAGTASEVRDMLPALERRYDHAALYSPSFTLTPERVTENTRAIIETFARRG
jgi:alkanesulfonate monooxygenase SsuD/methylene tetrahydromethanopterin reductase-like flavin-dependent oxidoreductase (luciferase family)